jgi:carboxymethylenebutenolidase
VPNTTYPASTGELRGYVASPTTPAPWPAVVVLHEAFGLTDDIRRQADRLAEAGYLAFAPDLLSYGFAPRCLVSTLRTLLKQGGGRAIEDIEAARTYLLARPDCTGKIGVIGFCMGGGFAILAAARGFDVSSPNYGIVPKNVDVVLRGSCPMVASYGAKDRGYKGAAAKLDTALAANGVDHDVEEYPNAGHAFMTGHTGNWAFAEWIPGMGYVPDAAEDAWARVLAYFGTHLRAGG